MISLFSCAPQIAVKHRNQALIDPQIRYGTLANGFQYLLVKNTTPKDRVNVHLNVFAGSVHETGNQQGLAHYLEHMMFNGSAHFKPGELIDYFQRIGMDFGGDANAHTSFFNTTYDLSLPSGDEKQLDEAFLVIQDYAQGALLLPEEIDRERGIILAEKRERDSVSYRTFKRSFAFRLPGSLLPNRMPIGDESVLKIAGQKELKRYYHQWYQPDNMALVVVGDLDPDLAQSLITSRFSKLKFRAPPAVSSPDISWKPHKGFNAFYHHEPEAGSTEVSIETVQWRPFRPETIDALKQNTIQSLASLMLNNRLSRMVTRQEADFLDAGTWAGTYLRHLSLSIISADCDPDKWAQSLEQIETTLRQALQHGFTQKELDRVKADYISMLDTAFNQSATRKSADIAKQLLSQINQQSLLLSAKQRRDILVPFIESILLSDANQTLQKIWSADHRLVRVTGNAQIRADNPEETILNAFSASIQKKVGEYRDSQSKSFPYLPFKSDNLHTRTDEKQVKELGISQIRYQNNLMLNLKQTDFKKNQFLFKVRFGTGRASTPKTKPGLAYLAEQVVQQSGLGSLDSDQLEEALAGKQVSYQFGIQEDYFTLSGTADPKETELVFQLIRHFISDPGFRPETLQLVTNRYQQEYEALLRTPDGMMKVMGNRFLAGDDPRFGLPSPAVISSYTLLDIKEWLLPHFQSSPIEISIAGDFDSEHLMALADKYLGAFQTRQHIDTVKLPLQTLAFPAGEKKEYRLDTRLDTGVVRLVFLTDDFWNISQTRRLSLLARVISERLRLVIREELGVAYSPYAYNAPSSTFDHYGLMHIVVEIKPGTQGFVLEKINQIIANIITNGISEDETQLALKPVLNHIKVLKQNNQYWLNSVLADSSVHPEKFSWALDMLDDYQSILSNDLWNLAKKYLKRENSAVIYIIPEK